MITFFALTTLAYVVRGENLALNKWDYDSELPKIRNGSTTSVFGTPVSGWLASHLIDRPVCIDPVLNFTVMATKIAKDRADALLASLPWSAAMTRINHNRLKVVGSGREKLAIGLLLWSQTYTFAGQDPLHTNQKRTLARKYLYAAADDMRQTPECDWALLSAAQTLSDQPNSFLYATYQVYRSCKHRNRPVALLALFYQGLYEYRTSRREWSKTFHSLTKEFQDFSKSGTFLEAKELLKERHPGTSAIRVDLID